MMMNEQTTTACTTGRNTRPTIAQCIDYDTFGATISEQQRLLAELPQKAEEDESSCSSCDFKLGVQRTEMESKTVARWRLVVLGVLAISTIAVALTTYLYLDGSERTEFANNFEQDSAKILVSIGNQIARSVRAADILAVGLHSYAKSSNSTWPFVTMPDFAIVAAKIRSTCNVLQMVLYPFVESSQKEHWEKYAADNAGWVQEGIEIQSKDDTYHGPILPRYDVLDYIHDDWQRVTIGPFMPTWQTQPVIPQFPPYNWDITTLPDTRAVDAVRTSRQVVLSQAGMLADPDDAVAVEADNMWIDWYADYVAPGQDPSEPLSDIFYPILAESTDRVRIYDDVRSNSSNNHNTTFLGMLGMSFYWADMIKGILPEGSNGLIVVFENECSPTFTYRINGPDVQYLGRGDHHDSSFDGMERSAALLDLDLSGSGKEYTGIPINADFCPFYIRVYPSNDFKDHYETNHAGIFSATVVLIFLFTSLVFILYDVIVQRRQKKVMATVMRLYASDMVMKSVTNRLEGEVTERTRLLVDTNKKLTDANRRVTQQAAEQLEHFASMSHEIRTPLNCVIGMSSLLLEKEVSPTEQREYLEMINKSGDLLRAVVNDVLDFSKLQSGCFDVEVQPTNVKALLAPVLHSIGVSCEKQNLTLSSHLDDSVPEFIATDSRRLQQILYNLLGNAVKFSKPWGTVELTVTASCSTDSDDGKLIRFAIKDNGCGIAQEHRETIFEPFNQASKDTERLYGGTGLGLAITSKIVKALGGTIIVDSAIDEWTEFVMTLPSSLSQEEATAEGAGVNSLSLPAAKGNRLPSELKVLIAEDNAVNQKILSRMLEHLGVQYISIVGDGEKAVESVTKEDYDLVFMDIQMPVMDGLEATQLILAQERQPRPKILFVTAHALDSFEAETKAAGGDGFITKPFKLDQIRMALCLAG